MTITEGHDQETHGIPFACMSSAYLHSGMLRVSKDVQQTAHTEPDSPQSYRPHASTSGCCCCSTSSPHAGAADWIDLGVLRTTCYHCVSAEMQAGVRVAQVQCIS